ncbi:hypothetical protein [Flavobacterium sp. MEB061]|uniref:hypothetical protein n=1 Tax=Flavobacterium sp. MEB061 TaxID=1587524 RepID=UPI000A813888|nr:hypothetical protein [Flavobacterium sp. MEB061]
MIYINPTNSKIVLARNLYLEKMLPLIFERIDKLTDRIAINYFDRLINDYLEDILSGTPELLAKLNEELTPYDSAVLKAIKYVFNYDWFTDKCVKRYDAYDLAYDLDVITCIYCNRLYTNTVITKNKQKIIRPQFDHFFDKDSNPLLALSFFNLIPSCSICNSNIKHGKKFQLKTHVHPYRDYIIDDFNFTYDYTSENKSGLRILINSETGSKIEKTFEDMFLETVYNSHISELKDLLELKSRFSDRYLSILSSNILGPSIPISQEELYRLAFGVELAKEDFYKRPFSKFKNDILKELNVI